MNNLLRMGLLNVVIMLILIGCDAKNDNVNEGPMTDDTTGLDTNETDLGEEKNKELILKIAMINMHEIKSGDLAVQKAQDQDLKDYGQTLIDDHRRANQKLQPLAQKNNVELPRQLDEEHKDKAQKLEETTQENFRKEFLDQMVKGHEKAINHLEDAQDDNLGTELKTYIEETLPTLKKHLDTAKKLQSKENNN